MKSHLVTPRNLLVLLIYSPSFWSRFYSVGHAESYYIRPLIATQAATRDRRRLHGREKRQVEIDVREQAGLHSPLAAGNQRCIQDSEAPMPFASAEFHDLVRLVEEHPEWRAELRRLVLTDSLLALPEQVAELRVETERRFQELAAAQQRTNEQVASLTQQVAELTAAQCRTEEQMTGLAAAQRRTEEQVVQLIRAVQSLVINVGDLKGEVFERRYRDRAAFYLGRIVRRIHTLSTDELAARLDDAVDQGQLSIADKDEVMLADLVVRGHRRDDDTAVYLLVEISWTIGPYNVERAVERASLLSRLGVPVLPVVAGKAATEAAEQRRVSGRCGG